MTQLDLPGMSQAARSPPRRRPAATRLCPACFEQPELPGLAPAKPQRRHRSVVRKRLGRVRGKVMADARLRRAIRADYDPTDEEILAANPRPRTRGECMPGSGTVHAQRPCPWVGCRHHLGLYCSTKRSGRSRGISVLEGWDDGEHSCALDVADDGPQALETVGELTGMTRERIRQMQIRVSRQYTRGMLLYSHPQLALALIDRALRDPAVLVHTAHLARPGCPSCKGRGYIEGPANGSPDEDGGKVAV